MSGLVAGLLCEKSQQIVLKEDVALHLSLNFYVLVFVPLHSEPRYLTESAAVRTVLVKRRRNHPAFSTARLCIVFWTFQIGLNVVIEKIVSTMQMRERSESAFHASNFYVDNLP